MATDERRNRAVSPVIGVALLVAIVVILTAVAGYVILGLTEESDAQPDVVIRLDSTDEQVGYTLEHVSGETLDGNRTTLIGTANEDALHGRTLRADDEVEIVPVESEIRLVWRGENSEHTLRTYEVNESSLPYEVDELDAKCSWVEEQMKSNSGDLDMTDDEAVCDVTGDTEVGATDVDIDLDSGSALVGNIDTGGDVDVDSSLVVGDVTTDSDDIVVTDESEIYGDIVAQPGTNIDIDGNSSVGGAVVVTSGSLSLDEVDVDGHVYVDPSDVSGCSNATLGPNDESCAEYGFRDPSNY